MKISVTFHEEGTPIQTVTFRRSRRQLVRERVQYNRTRRLLGVFPHWNETSWVHYRMRLWRLHFLKATSPTGPIRHAQTT